MSALEFHFQEMLNELSAISSMAEDFVAPSSRHVLPQFAKSLEAIRDSATTQTHRWEISDRAPLVTKISTGGYQRDGQGALNVFAEITCLWEVRRIRPPGGRSARAVRFCLAGITSTRVRLFEGLKGGDRGEQLAMWRMEIGDAASPGCHFHVQVLGESTHNPFPHSLDVPRLPALLLTPAAVLEFVLAELFQDEWAQHAARNSAHLQRWVPIQRRRLTAILAWQYGIAQRASGSPWAQLKAAKPDAALFCEGHVQLEGQT